MNWIKELVQNSEFDGKNRDLVPLTDAISITRLTLEKLIEDIPDTEECNCGCRQEFPNELKQQIRKDWL